MGQSPLIAIGLDAADFRQFEAWMDEGRLPVCAALRDRGSYGRLVGNDEFTAETPWTDFLTGVEHERTGFYEIIRYDPKSYRAWEETDACYDFKEFKPFYAVKGKKIAIFDPPQIRLIPGLDGIQVASWGSHSPLARGGSIPEDLMGRIEAEYGKNPSLRADHNDWFARQHYAAYKERLLTGIGQRAAICRDLLKKEPWDLLLTVFGESHAIAHDYFFTGRGDHPLSKHRDQILGENPVLEIFQKLDKAVGEILSAAPPDARVVLFTPHGMRANQADLPSTTFLPEFLLRKQFPGEGFFPDQPLSQKPGPVMVRPVKKGWADEVWRIKKGSDPLRALLKKILPFNYLWKLDKVLKTEQGKTFFVPYEHFSYRAIQPAYWYRHLWHSMRYFALPSYGDGSVRLNIKGREANGLVEPSDFVKTCDEIESFLSGLRSSRTGLPLVKRVKRIRKEPFDPDPKLPAPDLVVLWGPEPADVVEHPEAGRIGPLPFARTGSHVRAGFYLAAGPDIAKGVRNKAEKVVHLTSTLVHHMGSPIPAHMDGKKVLF